VGGRVHRHTPHPAREKLKLDYDHVAQFNPRLIYADITGYRDRDRTRLFPDSTHGLLSRTGLLSSCRDAAHRRPGHSPGPAMLRRAWMFAAI